MHWAVTKMMAATLSDRKSALSKSKSALGDSISSPGAASPKETPKDQLKRT
jgi:hypothetical protein